MGHTRLSQHGRLRLQAQQKAERRGLYGQLTEFREQTTRNQLEPLLKAAESKKPRLTLVRRIRRAFQRMDSERKRA